MTHEDLRAKALCSRFLSHHVPVGPAAMMRRLAEHPAAGDMGDYYGIGGAVTSLEARVAQLLGKPAARFMVKGVTAQLCVLHVCADRQGTGNVALHPLSHIDHDEANGAERVHGFHLVRLGRTAPFGVADLERVTEPLAAVVVELPLRRAAYRLPAFEELEAISRWCRDRQIPLHIDGARLWEAAAGYGVSLDAIASLADSVYVSFYKGLGGLGGAMVVGSESLIDSLGVWNTRLGGDLYSAYPYAISAHDGIERFLPRMPDFVDRARALAIRIQHDGTAAINPRTPRVNAFQLQIEGRPDQLAARNRAFAAARGVWMFNAFFDAHQDGQSICEIVIGDASDGYALDEAARWLGDFCSQA
jgi:threonine aldolase